MMRWLLITVLLMVGFSLATQVMLQDPGYVLVALGNKTLHMRFWPAIVLLTLVWILVYILVKGMQKLLFVARGRGWRAASSPQSSARRLQALLVAYFAHDWPRLLKESKRVLRQKNDLIPTLLAAQAAHELGEHEQRNELLAQAKQGHPQQLLAIGMLEAELLVSQGDNQRAGVTLSQLRRERPEYPAVLRLLTQTLRQQQAWTELLVLLPDLKRLHVLPALDYQQLERDVYVACLANAADVDALQSLWKKVAKPLKLEPEAVAAYTRALIRLGYQDLAEPILRKTLQRIWSEDLAALYGRLDQLSPQELLRHAESWLTQHGQQPALLLTLGRLCWRLELWGRARDYFEQAHNTAPSAQALVALAEVYTKLGDKPKSHELYERGLTEMAGQQIKV